MTGKVWLVGAGPGDPELLTLKAARILATADVVLCDDLVGEGILSHARAQARIVHVGKRGGCRSTPQEFIDRLMVAEARAGRTVVRLKGGDPLMFGRGGEEREALAAAGVECEVVNGVTAGIAAASTLGIALTRRGICHGAIFVTGHERDGRTTDWASLAATGLPLVIYMGAARCARIGRALLEGGMAADMPVAVACNATRPDERCFASTLSDLAAGREDARVASPAIIVVGRVAALSAAATAPAPAPRTAPCPSRSARRRARSRAAS
jgi:uroporphyrin-III C-methyltransferase